MSEAVGVALYLVPALVWGSMAVIAWRNVLSRRPRNPLLWLATVVTGLVALYYFLGVVLVLHPPGPRAHALALLRALGVIAAIACLRHIVPLSPMRAEPPRPRWLLFNYGLAVLVATVVVVVDTMPAASAGPLGAGAIVLAYFVAMSALNVWWLRRVAPRGVWGPGGLGEIRRSDVVWGAVGLPVLTGMATVLWVTRNTTGAPLWTASFEVAIGLAAAVPFAVRFMAEGARVFLTSLALLAATAAVYFSVRAVTPPDGAARDLAMILGLLLVVAPGQAWLRAGIDGLVFRRSRRRRAALQTILDGLSPEVGVVECCRRCLGGALQVMQLRGAAILLHDGEAVVCGDFSVATLRELWPRGEAARSLPARAFGGPEFRSLPLPLREAIAEARVVGVLPIVSPRRRWGDLFAAAGMMTAIYSEEDVAAWEAFAAQLALVLDAAGLIVRAVGVERSLAHAQKLAAMGEVAARIAHEIRNPVTAARSLAQQLAREPGSPFAAEHEVILTELERVERQVAALLRFARREEFRLEPLDLAQLAQATAEALRARLEAAGIDVVLDLRAGVTARADREKMRQVLINLIENAIDALAGASGGRRLAIAVSAANGTATLAVTDSGAGVPPDALPHLFEPFFSLKATGTGLGLAIARRTVEAHGGRIEARGAPGGGMTFELVLPGVEGAA